MKIKLLENDIEIKEEKIMLLTSTLADSKEEIILLSNRINESVQEKMQMEKMIQLRIKNEIMKVQESHEANVAEYEELIRGIKQEYEDAIQNEIAKSEKKDRKIRKLKQEISSSEDIFQEVEPELERLRILENEHKTLKSKYNSLLEKYPIHMLLTPGIDQIFET